MTSDAPKILIQDKKGVRSLEEGYASEKELQQFLRDNADLIPMDQIGFGTPPLLCIGFEVDVSAGAQDLLYVDRDGRLTTVETKLKKNPEVRREVVGQILEYAADTSRWSQSDIEGRARKFFTGPNSPTDYKGHTLSSAVELFWASGPTETLDFSYDSFVESLLGNLERGNIRLIIAVNEIHSSLLRTVEFVCRFSERFEIYLFQLRRFHDAATDANIFVPSLFGRVETGGGGRKQREWDEEKFKAELKAKTDVATQDYAVQIYEKFKAMADIPLWGTGLTVGTFNLVLMNEGRRVNLAAIGSNGDLWIHFGWMIGKVPEEIRMGLFESLKAIPGIGFSEQAVLKWPKVPHPLLKEPSFRQRVLEAITETVGRLRSTGTQ